MKPNDFALEKIVAGKLVLVALPSDPGIVAVLQQNGAKDILVLGSSGDRTPVRRSGHVARKFDRLSDIVKSNCEVAILESWASLALNRKRYFWKTRFQTILVPKGGAAALYFAGLRYYGRSQRLSAIGEVEIAIDGRSRRFLVIKVRRDKYARNQRLFAPHDWRPQQIFAQMHGIDYVLLRSVEAIESDENYKDIDVLVSDADLAELSDRFNEHVGTFVFDVYTESGSGGHDFHSVPYFFPGFARSILQSAELRASGIRVPSAKWRYLALAYHLIFHGKSEHLKPDAALCDTTFGKPRHYQALIGLARAAGFIEPRSFDDLDIVLRENGAFPGKDLIGFYARHNKFVAKRYLHRNKVRPGLAVFFVRDFGYGTRPVAKVADMLRREYEILAEGPVTAENRDDVLEKVRGGNWRDTPNSFSGEPVHWFACWDRKPKPPKGKMSRKYPHLDNERTALVKLHLRETEGGRGRAGRIVHASDNSDEALEHLRILGLERHPAVRAILEPEKRSEP